MSIKHCYKRILNRNIAGNTQIKTSTEHKLNYTKLNCLSQHYWRAFQSY